MIQLSLVGIGTGNPDHLTGQAIAEMRAADLVMVPLKGADKADLADLRLQLCASLAPDTPVATFDLPRRAADGDYLPAVADWHDAIARIWAETLAGHFPKGGKAVLLVWGDPSLYDSTLRIAERVRAGGMVLRVRVVPGITSLSALTAAHAIPLNTPGAPVVITTGRRLRDGGWPEGADSVAVMLDAGGAFQAIDPEGVQIWWGAYLGMPQEHLIAGPLARVGAQIISERASLRARHGWIMDIYLLRKARPDGPGRGASSTP
ncbi:precorrin-6A synthase (deacetylating) [Roseovarius autotrophicus]|uniref:precorrin-6A synthase (deacetylating) n=1 Tax=Roseovarius autotrophicus TaxID=2824121 RepID=UPI0019D9AE3A|nr:precorrin-6A synthase (deacetylating) [Roseovarius autotrophicus]MBE0453085.1 precorrin-6A synthase (deacetylating) [Roseovarius sp.]